MKLLSLLLYTGFTIFFGSLKTVAQKRNYDAAIDSLEKRISALENNQSVLAITNVLKSKSDTLKQLMANYYHAKDFEEKMNYVTEPQKFKQVLIEYANNFQPPNSKYKLSEFEVLSDNEILNTYENKIYYFLKKNGDYKIDILRSIGYNETSYADFKNDTTIKKCKIKVSAEIRNSNILFPELTDVNIVARYPSIFENVSFNKQQLPQLYNLLKSGKKVNVELEITKQIFTSKFGSIETLNIITNLISPTW